MSVVILTAIAAGSTAHLTATPARLKFGNIVLGVGHTKPVVLSNSGQSALTISSATLSEADFTLSGLSYPLTLAAGQSVSCAVRYTPVVTGAHQGNLAIDFKVQGGTVQKIETVAVSGTGVMPSQLAAGPTGLNFGSVHMGSSQTMVETFSNPGGVTLSILSLSTTGSGFSAASPSLPLSLNPGQSVNVNVTYAPAAPGSFSGNLAVTSSASNPALNVPLSGTSATTGQLTANPTSLSFGSVSSGSSASLAGTLANSGGSAVIISQISPTGAGFSLSGLSLPITLTPSQSVSFTVSFSPQSGGAVAGSLAVSSNGSNPSLSLPLSGTGTVPGQLSVGPSTINFGAVTVGTTQSQTGTLSATGTAVTVSSFGVSGSQFSASGIALPLTIPAGTSVSFQLTFAPLASGAASANVVFSSNASNSPASQSLTGSGALVQHSVALGWNTSTSSDVAGYNIYRGTASGGAYTRINSALDPSPFDTDNTVQSGQTYYYVVTAVDSTGAESPNSNQAQAVVPFP